VNGRAATVLERIVAQTRARVQERKRELPQRELERHPRVGGGDAARGRLAEALAGPGLGVIAEFKRRSPSAGTLREGADIEQIVCAYERGGASALSVLTEEDSFGGSLADLRAARAASALPILRKDFIVDPYQLLEARTAGADAVLLIVAALGLQELATLQVRAHELGLDTLVEVHDSEELRRAVELPAPIIGINNRDLRDLSVDVRRTSRLLAELPDGVACVSESGIAGAAQLRALAGEGVDAVLIGEALMRARDPERALRAILEGAGEARAPAAGDI
jgi:indole-3-glycerol phosphate synthase